MDFDTLDKILDEATQGELVERVGIIRSIDWAQGTISVEVAPGVEQMLEEYVRPDDVPEDEWDDEPNVLVDVHFHASLYPVIGSQVWVYARNDVLYASGAPAVSGLGLDPSSIVFSDHFLEASSWVPLEGDPTKQIVVGGETASGDGALQLSGGSVVWSRPNQYFPYDTSGGKALHLRALVRPVGESPTDISLGIVGYSTMRDDTALPVVWAGNLVTVEAGGGWWMLVGAIASAEPGGRSAPAGVLLRADAPAALDPAARWWRPALGTSSSVIIDSLEAYWEAEPVSGGGDGGWQVGDDVEIDPQVDKLLTYTGENTVAWGVLPDFPSEAPVYVSDTAPSNPRVGDVWLDTTIPAAAETVTQKRTTTNWVNLPDVPGVYSDVTGVQKVQVRIDANGVLKVRCVAEVLHRGGGTIQLQIASEGGGTMYSRWGRFGYLGTSLLSLSVETVGLQTVKKDEVIVLRLQSKYDAAMPATPHQIASPGWIIELTPGSVWAIEGTDTQ